MSSALLHRLDIEVAVYPDRVQAVDRRTGRFVDFPAERPFSSPDRLIANAACMEDALFKAVRQLLKGGFFLLDAKACLAPGQPRLTALDLAALEQALRNTGFSEISLDPHSEDTG